MFDINHTREDEMKKGGEELEMGRTARTSFMPSVDVQKRIVVVRRQSVILDVDVAALYGVETKHVNQAVRNNQDKSPADYVFALTADEVKDLRSKFFDRKSLVKEPSLAQGVHGKGALHAGDRAQEPPGG